MSIPNKSCYIDGFFVVLLGRRARFSTEMRSMIFLNTVKTNLFPVRHIYLTQNLENPALSSKAGLLTPRPQSQKFGP